MKIIVGLGNPGRKYATTRHNVGFQVIDKLAAEHQLKSTRSLTLTAHIARKKDALCEVCLVKPLTYMNRSGDCVRKVLRRYDCTFKDLLFIYDDIALDLGVVRFRRQGSSGGHRGMQSVIEAVDTTHLKRIRVGVCSPHERDVAEYVLSSFKKDEAVELNRALTQATAAAWDWVEHGSEYAMQKHNRKQPPLSAS